MGKRVEIARMEEKKMVRRSHVIFLIVSMIPLVSLTIFLSFYVFPDMIEKGESLVLYTSVAILGVVFVLCLLGYFISIHRIRKMMKTQTETTQPSLLFIRIYIFESLIPLGCLAMLLFMYILPEFIRRGDTTKLYSIIGVVALCFALSFLGYSLSKRDMSGTFETLKIAMEKMDTLVTVSTSITGVTNIDEVCNRIVVGVHRLLEVAAVYLFTQDTTEWIFRDEAGLPWKNLEDDDADFLTELRDQVLLDHNVLCFDARRLKKKYFKSRLGNQVQVMVAPLMFGTECQGAILLVNKRNETGEFTKTDIEIVKALALQGAISIQNAEYRETQINYFTHTTGLLVSSMEGNVVPRDHLHNVARYAGMMSRKLKIEEKDRRDIYFAALLHDIGMLKIRPEMIAQPKHFKQHPLLGARMVGRIILWKNLVPIIEHHHEHYDGSGYPSGLVGPEIPLFARIIFVAESFDAMTNPNSYRPLMSFEDALKDLKSFSGERYDPKLVEIFEQGLIENELIKVE